MHRADNLITFFKIWESQTSGAMRACNRLLYLYRTIIPQIDNRITNYPQSLIQQQILQERKKERKNFLLIGFECYKIKTI